MYNLHNLQWDIATKIQTVIIIVRRLKSPAIRFLFPKLVHHANAKKSHQKDITDPLWGESTDSLTKDQ